MCGLSNAKILIWDSGLWYKGANFSPLQSHAVIQVPRFPQLLASTPPDPAPLTLHKYTCDTVSKLAEDDISTLEIFFVWYSKCLEWAAQELQEHKKIQGEF